jgi:hypothetical protein
MYKKLLVLVVLLCTGSLLGQFNDPTTGSLTSALGLTYINGQPFYAVRISPEFALGNFGFGLDLNMEFGSDGSIRKENFNDATDYLSIIRYVRYGQKNDPVYVKLGAVDYYTLGHGSIMYLYNNRPSIDNKKIGLGFDLNMEKWGFESIYSDFSQAGVIGMRGNIKPLKLFFDSSIPVLSKLELGATYVSDMSKDAHVEGVVYNPVSQKIEQRLGTKSLNEYGVDAGLPIYKSSVFNSQLYYDFAKIQDLGSGSSAGILLDINLSSFVTLGARFERRWNKEQYMPSLFNWLYEINRFDYNPATDQISSVYQTLKNMHRADNGNFGSLKIDVLNLVKVYGSYERLDKTPESGVLDIKAEAAPQNLPVVARAGYSKTNITNEGGMFRVDDHSYLYTELGYKPYSYLLVSMFYIWTFEPVRDANKAIVGYTPQKKIEPRISFIYPFDLNGK